MAARLVGPPALTKCSSARHRRRPIGIRCAHCARRSPKRQGGREIEMPFSKLRLCARRRNVQGHRSSASARRPTSVMRKRMTSIGRLPATMRSVCAIASRAVTSSTSMSTVNP